MTPVFLNRPTAPIREIAYRAGSLEEYVEHCKKKIAATEYLCMAVERFVGKLMKSHETSNLTPNFIAHDLAEALRAWLCFELDIAANPEPEDEVLKPEPYRVSLEEFEMAQRRVDGFQANWDAIMRQFDGSNPNIPDPLRQWAETSANLLLKPQLDEAIAYRDHLQGLMEKQSSGE